MSTAVVLSHAAHGHINPTLPVVAELVRRGERIIYYATEPFRSKVEQTGAQFRSYGSQDLFERQLGVGGMLGGMAGLMETAESILPDLLDQVRASRPDYLLLDSHAVWGNLVQQALNLPAVTLCAMFAINDAAISADRLVRGLYERTRGETILGGLLGLCRYLEIARRIDRRYGTHSPSIVDYLGNQQALNIVFTSRYFQIAGEQFDESYKFVGPSLAPRQDPHLFPFEQLGPEPLIYISPGTMFNSDPEFYRVCFEAFANSSCQVVLSFGQRIAPSALPKPPKNFIIHPYVPQLEILERTALFITHGGMNSASEGFFYDVPMIFLPNAADHFVVANRAVELGAGLSLHRAEITPQRLGEMAARVLADSSFKEQCGKIGESLRSAGGYRRAADEIFAFTRQLGLESLGPGRP